VSWAPALPPQDTPDFSGQWILETVSASAVDVPKALSVTMRLVRTNARGEPMKPFFKDMVVTREFRNRSTVETHLLGVVRGSVPSPQSHDARTHERVSWEKQSLVIEVATHTGFARETGEWTEHREVWSLDSERRLQVEIADKSSSGPPFAATLVYKRKPQTTVKQSRSEGFTSLTSSRCPSAAHPFGTGNPNTI
jgi:hypothetical protein